MSKLPIDFSYLKRLFSYTRPYRLLFYTVLVLVIVVSGISMFRPWLTRVVVDEYIYAKDIEGLIRYSWIIVGVLIVEVVGNATFIYQSNRVAQFIVRDIRKKVFDKALRFKMSYFDMSSVGIMVTRTVNDTERIAEVFSSGFFEIVSDILKMLIVLCTMFYFDWELTLMALVICPVIIYATRLFQKGMKKAFTEVRTQVAELNSFVQEHISGMKIVQLFGREKQEYEKFVSINEKHKKAWIKTVWYNSIFFPISDLASSITIGLIVWYSSVKMLSSSSLDVGLVMMFIQLSHMFFRPLRHIAEKFNSLQMGIIAAKRVFVVLDTKDITEIENTNSIDITSPLKGKLVFKDVYFGYFPNEKVLKGVNFTANPSEKIAIVGATGAGKTTISSLINRFYEMDKGQILIDDVPINKYKIASLRKHISIVLQDIFLFADTIFQNISLGQAHITKEKVIQATKDINCYEFISSLPGGLDYNVKERGNVFSVGQKQIISFLRIYVNNPSILILDEATSSVDTQTEKLVQQAIDKITSNRTSIIIAHRLETIKKADTILVMDSGKIVEQGNHIDLLSRKGYYYDLYQSQLKLNNTVADLV